MTQYYSASPPYDHNNATAQQSHTSVLPVPVVAIFSADGGLGASTFALQLARMCSQMGLRVCLIDGDFYSGGLDVLAGCEEQEGLRWNNVQAPLGSIDPHGFLDELVSWENVHLLASRPWEGTHNQWWEIKAVYEAAAPYCDVIICDCGRRLSQRLATAWKDISSSILILPIILMRLTTLGIVRCSCLVNSLKESLFKEIPSSYCEPLLYIAPEKPRGLFHSYRSQVSAAQVEDYLHLDIVGKITYDSRIPRFEDAGWGIAPTHKSCQRLLKAFIRDYILSRSFRQKELMQS
ncbi:P-loop NTPase [Alloscardovia omnicolens]|uniref:P-loop NTPase n=1 Tax=Alloscardovia omnicolens TaxID=419015 RepID=UPI003A69EFA3